MTFNDFIERLRLPFREEKELRQQLQCIIGFYPNDIKYYKTALTHKSSGQRNDKGKPLNNERLEFLGDALLDAVVGDIVFEHFEGKREGFLTNTRSKLVSRETLGKLAEEMGLTELIQSRGQSRSHNSYMAGNAFEALVGAIYLDQGYAAVMRFMKKRILAQMVNIDKVAYKEVNFKSKLLEWAQRNRVRMEFCMLKQERDKQGSPVFGFQVMIEGVEGSKGQGFSKKEAQQLASKGTLERLRREPQFIEAIFAAKSVRTKMEEEPTMAAPNLEAEKTDFIIAQNREQSKNAKVLKDDTTPSVNTDKAHADDDFDLSDITHQKEEVSREDIIAAAEEAAFAESRVSSVKVSLVMLLLALSVEMATAGEQQYSGYPIEPVPFTSVKVVPQTFWGQRLDASRRVTVPLAFQKCEETGRYTNFENAAAHLKDAREVFEIKPGTFSFDDTDPYKTIEGASYLLQTYPDMKLYTGGREVALRQYVDSVIDIIATAQEPDGYLYTARTQNPLKPHEWAGPTRWVKEEDLSHELYNLGHMVESAIAHYQATGSRKFLDIAIRYADCVCREVGRGEGQARVVPGHQIAEMALAKLYLVTGDRKYLDEAKFFLDERGKTHIKNDYSQSHKPVVEQREAVGHAVRAGYMYAGMADVAALTGDSTYIRAIDRIWENIVSKKLYITGGIGSTSSGEAFGRNYQLPNMTAYCETCAAIANVYTNYRLFLLHGDSKYFDVLERSLYNGLISGMSLQGNGFFYPNPLESDGQHERKPWFGCACCPSNLSRFIPSLPGYVYAVKENSGEKSAVYVNLYLSNSSVLRVGGKEVALTQQTNYPWDGSVKLTVDKNKVGLFTLKLRIPGWVQNQPVPSDLYQYADGEQLGYRLTVNGDSIPVKLSADGYAAISRKWKKGDCVELHLDMKPRLVKAHWNVEADRGRVAVERGPLVYCVEHPDNQFDIFSVLMSRKPHFSIGRTTIADTEVQTIGADAQLLEIDQTTGRQVLSDVRLTLIPYYAWAHRGKGRMRVWLLQDVEAATYGK